MTIPDSLILYNEVKAKTMDFLKDTLNEPNNSEITNCFQNSHRIFFTGSGSSAPAALFGASLLSMRSTLSAQYVMPSIVLNNSSLNKKDTVVLISQGMNRGEAVLTAQKVAQETESSLIIYTGHPERVENNGRTFVQRIYPEREKLFCRPASPITSYAAIARSVTEVCNEKIDADIFIRAFSDGQKNDRYAEILKTTQQSPEELNNVQFIVLSSELSFPSALHLTLALREGSGISAEAFDIESYGHGWYVTHQLRRQLNPKTVCYILMHNTQDSHLTKALDRIMPLIQQTNSPYVTWRTDKNSLYGNCELMAQTAQLIGQINSASRFDMNNPPGMNENRLFHELTK